LTCAARRRLPAIGGLVTTSDHPPQLPTPPSSPAIPTLPSKLPPTSTPPLTLPSHSPPPIAISHQRHFATLMKNPPRVWNTNDPMPNSRGTFIWKIEPEWLFSSTPRMILPATGVEGLKVRINHGVQRSASRHSVTWLCVFEATMARITVEKCRGVGIEFRGSKIIRCNMMAALCHGVKKFFTNAALSMKKNRI
jgi:hypothetical protein